MIKGVAAGAAATVFAVLWAVIKHLAEFLAKLIYYLGLWAPILYLVYGGVLQLVFKGFFMFAADINSTMYLVGLALSVVAALIITVRNLIIRPFRKYFKRNDVVDYDSKDKKLSKGAPEAPRIYLSRVNDGVTVYEYSNRYDLYEERDDRLVLVGTEYKKGNKKRK